MSTLLFVDKFIKMAKRKSNDSLDEGYTTDENYDYRRFNAFLKTFYDEPGSVISSFDEPDYKIPEFNSTTTQLDSASQSIYMNQQMERIVPPQMSLVRQKQIDLPDTTEQFYDNPEHRQEGYVDMKTKREIETESPYDEVGEVLSKKVDRISLDIVYDEPEIVEVVYEKPVQLRKNKPKLLPRPDSLKPRPDSLKLDPDGTEPAPDSLEISPYSLPFDPDVVYLNQTSTEVVANEFVVEPDEIAI